MEAEGQDYWGGRTKKNSLLLVTDALQTPSCGQDGGRSFHQPQQLHPALFDVIADTKSAAKKPNFRPQLTTFTRSS